MGRTEINAGAAGDLCRVLGKTEVGEIRRRAREFAQNRGLEIAACEDLAGGLRHLGKACDRDATLRLVVFDSSGAIRTQILPIVRFFMSQEEAVEKTTAILMPSLRMNDVYVH